jgi:RNA polymerase sigma-70 factor (ECF subfamily)
MGDRKELAERGRLRQRLMERAQGGDGEAYRALLDDLGPELMRFLSRRLDSAAAEDAYQDTLLAVHRARHTYRPSRPLEPWLYAIARNVVVDHLRRRRARARWEVEAAEGAADGAASSMEEAAPELRRALGHLPQEQREALEMIQVEGLSVEAAAARAGVTRGALKVRAHRAYRALKGWLGG